jgi:hypothetical protein
MMRIHLYISKLDIEQYEEGRQAITYTKDCKSRSAGSIFHIDVSIDEIDLIYSDGIVFIQKRVK